MEVMVALLGVYLAGVAVLGALVEGISWAVGAMFAGGVALFAGAWWWAGR